MGDAINDGNHPLGYSSVDKFPTEQRRCHMKATCSVVVIYEDPSIREVAVDFCDHLVEQFWNKCGFDMSWWSFPQLREPVSAHEATQRTKAADLIVIAVQPGGPMDVYAQAWLETGLKQRGE